MMTSPDSGWFRRSGPIVMVGMALVVTACEEASPANQIRVSGQVEATEIRIAPEIGGRVVEMRVEEGDRVAAGDLILRIDPRDIELAFQRTRAELAQAEAQLRLLQSGARGEDIRQAQAQVAAADADVAAAQADLQAAEGDLQRYETLLQTRSGSAKQRDDAATRRDVARERVTAGEARRRAAAETLARLEAGSRPEEIAAAAARVDAVKAEMATLDKALDDTTVTAPAAGIVTEKLVESGEVIAPSAPAAIITDLDHAWADVFVPEPAVPRIRIGQSAVLFTDAGGTGMPGTVIHVSPQAEFTPRNVQTADERSLLVYRIRISVDNASGVLKQGMPVEADIPLAPIG